MADYFFPMPNATTLPHIFTHANVLTDNLFGVAVLVIVFIVSLALGSRDDIRKGYAGASFITMLTSFFFGILELISGEIILIFIIMTALSIFILRQDH